MLPLGGLGFIKTLPDWILH